MPTFLHYLPGLLLIITEHFLDCFHSANISSNVGGGLQKNPAKLNGRRIFNQSFLGIWVFFPNLELQ